MTSLWGEVLQSRVSLGLVIIASTNWTIKVKYVRSKCVLHCNCKYLSKCAYTEIYRWKIISILTTAYSIDEWPIPGHPKTSFGKEPNKVKKKAQLINEKADAANVIIPKYLLYLLLSVVLYCSFQLIIPTWFNTI